MVVVRSSSDQRQQLQQTLTFEPAPSFVVQGAQHGLDAVVVRSLPADGIRYRLEIIPARGFVGGETYTLSLGVHGGVPGKVYLPLVMR